MLRILTFDSTRLTPSMGYVFDPKWLDPFESIVGMLWKFACANGVAGHTVVGQLTDDPVDVYAAVAPTTNEIAVPVKWSHQSPRFLARGSIPITGRISFLVVGRDVLK